MKGSPRVAFPAVVLAAGLSARMAPRNKLLAAMPNGRLMIAQTVDNVLASAPQSVLVVTGHQDAEIRAALAGRPVDFAYAPDYANGMAASLRAGIAALPANAAGVLICLGDMPLVEPETLDRITAFYDPDAGREIIVPSYNGQRGNPVLWGHRFFHQLMQLSGDTGAKQILNQHARFVAEIAAETESVLRDFDTAETLRQPL